MICDLFTPGTIHATHDRDGDWPGNAAGACTEAGHAGSRPLDRFLPSAWVPPAGEVTSSSGSIGPISHFPNRTCPGLATFLAVDSCMRHSKTRYIAFSCSWSGLLHDDARKCPEPEKPIATRRWHRSVMLSFVHPTRIFQVPSSWLHLSLPLHHWSTLCCRERNFILEYEFQISSHLL